MQVIGFSQVQIQCQQRLKGTFQNLSVTHPEFNCDFDQLSLLHKVPMCRDSFSASHCFRFRFRNNLRIVLDPSKDDQDMIARWREKKTG